MANLDPFDWKGLLERLKEQEVEFVIIGGVAASLHGSAQATFDLDVCVPLNDDNIRRIHAALRDIHPYFRFRQDRMPLYEDVTKLYGFKNLNLGTDLGKIDLLGDLPSIGVFGDLVHKVSVMDINGMMCRVLDVDTLIACKKAAGRMKDLPNLYQLEAIKRMQQQKPGLSNPSEGNE